MRGTPGNVQANQRIEERERCPHLNFECLSQDMHHSLPAQHSVEGEAAGSVMRTIHAVGELQVVPQSLHVEAYGSNSATVALCLYAQERPAGI